jgi:hypothetical protein
MHTRKFIIAGLLSTTSLSVLALIGAQQAQIKGTIIRNPLFTHLAIF